MSAAGGVRSECRAAARITKGNLSTPFNTPNKHPGGGTPSQARISLAVRMARMSSSRVQLVITSLLNLGAIENYRNLMNAIQYRFFLILAIYK